MNSDKDFEGDAGPPLPNFSSSNISLGTVAPTLGVPSQRSAAPDYLDYDSKGRGIVVTMFANSGLSYLLGTGAGGFYGIRQGLASSPSSRLRVQVNSVLNHSGRHGSKWGNTVGIMSVLYSLYEGAFDRVSPCLVCFFLSFFLCLSQRLAHVVLSFGVSIIVPVLVFLVES